MDQQDRVANEAARMTERGRRGRKKEVEEDKEGKDVVSKPQKSVGGFWGILCATSPTKQEVFI